MLIHSIASVEKREIADVLVIPFFKDEIAIPDVKGLEALCMAPMRAHDFEGREGQLICVWGQEPQEKRIFLLGLSRRDAVQLETIRKAYGQVAKACMKYRCKSITCMLPQCEKIAEEAVVKALLEGLYLAGYSYDVHKSEPEVLLDECTLIGRDVHLIAKAAERTKRVMTAIWRARDLVNGNADDVTPKYLAQFAKELGQEFPRVKSEVKDKAWIEQQSMGLLLAVSRGSHHEPHFIICSYDGNPSSSERTVLVGKGITYDTGGLKLKSVEGMLSMRSDMSGAAVSLAVVEAVASLGLAVNLTCVIPTCENAISSLSYKLGDVYKSRAGITVEVTNTDAEGRLILADALSYAADVLKPTRIIDIGTLTGGLEVALGNELMGLFSNSDLLAEELLACGMHTHERSWRMPLYEEYREQLKSDIADIKNAATPKAGPIRCAIFLQQFVKNVPWAHIDIANVAFAKEARGYWPKHATGIGIRLLVEYFELKR